MRKTVSLRRTLRMFAETECASWTSSWIARVPSSSNPADGPSKLIKHFKDGVFRGEDRTDEVLALFHGCADELIGAARETKRVHS